MARKRKVADEKPAPNGSTSQPKDTKKRKIDWSTIEQAPDFKITAVNIRTQKKSKKSAKSKQDTANGGDIDYPGVHEPLDADLVQSNPFTGAQLNDLHVKITPALYWESMRRYRMFTIGTEEFQVGQMVFVKKSEEDLIAEGPGAIKHWLAKVLEIRAGDAAHVYLRVFWAYRPEDLPGGRQAHHGASELIVSNHMDIIEAVTVESSATVVYWNDDLESLNLKTDQLFFRQSYDITKGTNSRFSKLNTYCINKKPCNPDELVVQCPHCSDWLHSGCLKKRALKDAASQSRKQDRPSKAQASITFDAKLREKAGKTRLTILEMHEGQLKRKWDVDIPCLVCGKLVEEASDKAPKKFKPRISADQGGAEALSDDKINTTPKTPIQDGDADSVISDADADQGLEVKDPPTSDAQSQVPRKRGRPLGSKNKRKRTSYSPIKKSTVPNAKYHKTETGKEAVSPDTLQNMATSAAVATTATTVFESAQEARAETVLDLANDATVRTVSGPVKSTTRTLPESPRATFEPTPTKSEPAEDVPLETATYKTPAPAPISQSIFQSGVRSVKKLFWLGS